MDLTHLRRQQRAAPAAPGVYFFRAPNGTPLYIGKAKSLRHRLGSHLSHPATRGGVRLLEETATLDYIICESEWQALLLEQELVAAAQPTYNVALRFGRRYPRIAVSWDETFPRVYASTERAVPGRRYFGPYEGEHAGALIDLLARLYPFRSCEGAAPGRASGSPCLDFFIHRCEAPCVGYVDAAAYRQQIQQVMGVLAGDWRAPTLELEARMHAAAAAQHFEGAARWRDDFLRLQQLCGRDTTSAVMRVPDCDAIALAQSGVAGEADEAGTAGAAGAAGEDACAHLQLLRVRSGVLAGRESLILERTSGLPEPALLREALLAAYAPSSPSPPALVLLGSVPEDAELLARLLSQRRGAKVSLRVPQRGELVRLLSLAQRNAAAALRRAQTQAGKPRSGGLASAA